MLHALNYSFINIETEIEEDENIDSEKEELETKVGKRNFLFKIYIFRILKNKYK